MRYYNAIEQKLTQALSPTRLEITDNSHKHVGHAGAHPEGESHFALVVVSEAFEARTGCSASAWCMKPLPRKWPSISTHWS